MGENPSIRVSGRSVIVPSQIWECGATRYSVAQIEIERNVLRVSMRESMGVRGRNGD
jgi:hypothetical protein